MTFPKTVRIVEVGPRDGLQNETSILSTDMKIDFINRLSKTGLKTIEVTSFVSSKRIPQLADAKDVLNGIQKISGVHYPVLVPNLKGLEAALLAGAKEIAVFTAASETFSQKNTECSIETSFQRIEAILTQTKKDNIPVRAYISCALGCPFEGAIPAANVVNIARRLFTMGCNEISIGDTIGVGTPGKASDLITALAKHIPISNLAVHFHDTYGQALANIYACLELGISIIDSAISGLGGCPYAKGATGNVATEDVLYMLEGLGIHTGVDMNTLIEVSRFVSEFTKRSPRSKVAEAKFKAAL